MASAYESEVLALGMQPLRCTAIWHTNPSNHGIDVISSKAVVAAVARAERFLGSSRACLSSRPYYRAEQTGHAVSPRPQSFQHVQEVLPEGPGIDAASSGIL